MPAIRHHSLTIDHLHVFVREAGDRDRPTLVLLPGYPSSTRAYVRLIDRLAEQWHTVAIDYPGFGQSDPLPQSPTFDRLAEVTGKTIDALAIKDYAIYMFDFGAPVGFRIALEHDQRVAAIITQNANAYTDGFRTRRRRARQLVGRPRRRPARRRRVRQPARHPDAMAGRCPRSRAHRPRTRL